MAQNVQLDLLCEYGNALTSSLDVRTICSNIENGTIHYKNVKRPGVIKMNKLFKGLAFLAVFTASTAANAIVIVAEDGTYCVGTCETTFIGDVETTGGAGSWSVFFQSDTDPLNGTFSGTIGDVNLSLFTDLMVQWISMDDDYVLQQSAITAGTSILQTIFLFAGNTDVCCGTTEFNDLNQELKFSWTDSYVSDNAYGFDFSVVVPEPAIVGILGLGLLGLGFGRRKNAK